jgi:N-methylhydantoinase A/oxoprolinase/acetone carboxylase beta subunit
VTTRRVDIARPLCEVPRVEVGVDAGGTFTDLVAGDGRVTKVSSTPDDPSRAVVAALGEAGIGHPQLLSHGTTVATNALLERRGAQVALVTNRGFADLIEIARQTRPSLYDARVDRPAPLVPRERRFETDARLDATGAEIVPVPSEPVEALPDDVEAVAVCLLHADVESAHERAVARVLRERGLDVTCSHEVAPEMREYERTITTIVNAMLRPRCRAYLRALEQLADEVTVMASSGGLVPVDVAAELPAALLLSGPAGGVRAAGLVADACGFPDAVSFDMGGTSTDVCLVRNGVPDAAAQRAVAGYPIRLPALDVHTIGAGGGSIARIDAGGALVVGPESAGAVPGPACYGRGGEAPTVTDADLVLGRIDPAATFPDLGRLDVDAARAALDRAGVAAAGVLEVVDAAMEQAVRLVTVARGVDPRTLALVAFGGAGPLHACTVADALGMQAVIVPARAGALSAVGLLASPRQRDLVRSWPRPADHDVAAALAALGADAAAAVGPGARVTTTLDCRYAGQSYELTVEAVGSFHTEHERRNGFARRDTPVEVVALRARAALAAPLALDALPEPHRASVEGPAVVAEADATTWVPDGWRAEPAALGAWVLRRT